MNDQRQGYGRGDGIGTWAPVGSSGAEKDLFRFPKEIEAIAPGATVMIRGRTSNERLGGLYGLALSLAGDHKPTIAFTANMQAARVGVRGLARAEFEMALARMLVPHSMPAADERGSQDGRQNFTKRSKKDGAGDNE